MGKKEIFWGHSSFWSFFSRWSVHKLFSWKGFFREYISPNFSSVSVSAGFTLVELVIVTALLGGVSILVFTTINPVAQYQRANDAQRKNDLGQLQKALESYYQDNGSYPLSAIDYKIVSQSGQSVNWGGPWLPYMSKVPDDPSDTKWYSYYSVNGQSYYIYASLDRGGIDTAACNKGSKCTSAPVNVVCGAGVCNFGVSSANVSP